MARLADGDRSVFTRVFDLLWTPLFRLCRGLLRHEESAKDAAQNAMQKIFERASDYDPRRPAMPWAMAIAGYECRTIAKASQRRREVAEDAGGERAFGDTEESLVQRDLIAAALEALGELSDNDRETLITTFSDELEAAPGATFRKRRERALTRLRTAFRRLYGLD